MTQFTRIMVDARWNGNMPLSPNLLIRIVLEVDDRFGAWIRAGAERQAGCMLYLMPCRIFGYYMTNSMWDQVIWRPVHTSRSLTV